MITEGGDHWIERGDEEVTIAISGQPGAWIVNLRRGKVRLASAACMSLEDAFADAIETSAKLVRLQDRLKDGA